VGKGHLCAWAMEAAVHALEFFTDYFAIAYPGDKVDLVAIPDFAAGAMENLGCVTFRETELLIDPATASTAELERVALVINHELAHMWFGDLVTMGWWEGIWLNEAFATFMESICTDHFRPEWKKWVSFNPSRDMAFTVDGQHSTRPIEYEVISPNDCRGMFDILTYVKGCSILRMLEQFLGEETFRDGIRIYLKRHAYANTVTADLWAALEEASSLPVGQIMDTWIYQGGHPIITVDGGVVSQSPFSYGPVPEGATSAIGSTWQVPLLTRHIAGGDITATLLGKDPVVLGDGAGSVVANAGGSGVYRVAYAPADAAVIAAELERLLPLERGVLMNDAWAATLAGKMELGAFLTLADNLGDDDEPATWQAVCRALGFLSRIATDAERPAVSAAAVHLLSTKAATLGWEPVAGEGERVPGLRSTLLQTLGTVGEHAPMIAGALERFDGDAPLNRDLEAAILDIVASANRPGDYDRILTRYENPSNPQEEVTYLMALAAFDDHVAATFEMARTTVRTQNAPFLIAQLIANRTGSATVWSLVEANFADLLAKFPENSHSRMVSSVSMLAHDQATAARATAFLTVNPIKTGQLTVRQALERLANNAGVAARLRGTLSETLAPFGG